jgi:hypothetical protein
MSDQRRMRAELKQGLHQFMMTLYQSYKKTAGHDQAVKEVASCLEEEHLYFLDAPIQQESDPPLSLAAVIAEVERKTKTEKEQNAQYVLYEDLETLLSAQAILNKYTSN